MSWVCQLRDHFRQTAFKWPARHESVDNNPLELGAERWQAILKSLYLY